MISYILIISIFTICLYVISKKSTKWKYYFLAIVAILNGFIGMFLESKSSIKLTFFWYFSAILGMIWLLRALLDSYQENKDNFTKSKK